MPKSVYTDQYRAFRQSLINARKAADLTQYDLAQRLSKPQSFVSKFELGERRLDIIEFIAVARAIGVNPCDIIHNLDTLYDEDK